MPPWIIAAMRLLGTGLAFGVGSELISQNVQQAGLSPISFAQSLVPGGGTATVHPGTVHDIMMHKRRRRRRRALTASDKVDIAFIAGILGKAAGGRFAVALGARSR